MGSFREDGWFGIDIGCGIGGNCWGETEGTGGDDWGPAEGGIFTAEAEWALTVPYSRLGDQVLRVENHMYDQLQGKGELPERAKRRVIILEVRIR